MGFISNKISTLLLVALSITTLSSCFDSNNLSQTTTSTTPVNPYDLIIKSDIVTEYVPGGILYLYTTIELKYGVVSNITYYGGMDGVLKPIDSTYTAKYGNQLYGRTIGEINELNLFGEDALPDGDIVSLATGTSKALYHALQNALWRAYSNNCLLI